MGTRELSPRRLHSGYRGEEEEEEGSEESGGGPYSFSMRDKTPNIEVKTPVMIDGWKWLAPQTPPQGFDGRGPECESGQQIEYNRWRESGELHDCYA